MTSAALAMLVAGAGRGHTVIAGDFRQLPPVTVADTPAAQEWLRRSPFEKAGITSAVSEGRMPARLAALTEQYRMREHIGHIVSTAFYPESPLVTAPSVAGRPVRSRVPWASAQLAPAPVSCCGPSTTRSPTPYGACSGGARDRHPGAAVPATTADAAGACSSAMSRTARGSRTFATSARRVIERRRGATPGGDCAHERGGSHPLSPTANSPESRIRSIVRVSNQGPFANNNDGPNAMRNIRTKSRRLSA